MKNKFKINNWIVDPEQCLLVCSPKNYRLEPKAMSLLVILAKAEGELVSRQALFNLLWPNQHVTDYALNTLISNLRKNLENLEGIKGGAKLIETRPKLGYRLNIPIEWLGTTINETGTVSELNSNKQSLSLVNKRVYLSIAIIFVTVSILLIGSVTIGSSKVEMSANENHFQYRYISKITNTVEYSYKNKEGMPICKDRTFEEITRLTFNAGRWTLLSEFSEIMLKHTGRSLLGIKENYYDVYVVTIGKVKTHVDLDFSREDGFTGRANWEIVTEGELLVCKGRSIITSQKI